MSQSIYVLMTLVPHEGYYLYGVYSSEQEAHNAIADFAEGDIGISEETLIVKADVDAVPKFYGWDDRIGAEDDE